MRYSGSAALPRMPPLAATVAGSAHSPVAQLAEHPTVNRRVTGSSPVGGATCRPANSGFPHLAGSAKLISVNHAEAIRDLAGAHHPETGCLGIGLTTVALLEMPLLGQAKQKLGARLNSPATAGEGRQNYLCAAQAAAVLTGLVITTAWPDGWWTDPVIALGIAAWAIYEGNTAWRGDPCGC